MFQAKQLSKCFQLLFFGLFSENVKKQDITDYAQCLLRILKQAADISERVTATKLVDAWKGRGQASLRIRGVSPPKLSQEECERVVVHLLLEGVFKEEFHFTPYSTISYLVPGPRGNSVLAGSKVKMTLVQHEKGTTKVCSLCFSMDVWTILALLSGAHCMRKAVIVTWSAMHSRYKFPFVVF